MTGLVGALVVLAAVLALMLVLAVRPHARRLDRAAAALRADTDAGLARLRALRPARRTASPATTAPAITPLLPAGAASVRSPSAAADPTSTFGGRGRHRRVDGQP
jgi:hypothetical protein